MKANLLPLHPSEFWRQSGTRFAANAANHRRERWRVASYAWVCMQSLERHFLYFVRFFFRKATENSRSPSHPLRISTASLASFHLPLSNPDHIAISLALMYNLDHMLKLDHNFYSNFATTRASTLWYPFVKDKQDACTCTSFESHFNPDMP